MSQSDSDTFEGDFSNSTPSPRVFDGEDGVFEGTEEQYENIIDDYVLVTEVIEKETKNVVDLGQTLTKLSQIPEVKDFLSNMPYSSAEIKAQAGKVWNAAKHVGIVAAKPVTGYWKYNTKMALYKGRKYYSGTGFHGLGADFMKKTKFLRDTFPWKGDFKIEKIPESIVDTSTMAMEFPKFGMALVKKMATVVRDVGLAVKAMIADFSKLTTMVWENLKYIFTKIPALIKDLAIRAAATIKKKLEEAIITAKKKLEGSIEIVRSSAEDALNKINVSTKAALADLELKLTGAKKSLEESIEKVRLSAEEALNKINDKTQVSLMKLESEVTAAVDKITGILNFHEGRIKDLEAKFNEMKKYIPTIPTTIPKWFTWPEVPKPESAQRRPQRTSRQTATEW